MIELAFTPADYRRIRFAFSPVTEAVTSLRALSACRRNGVHGPWLAAVADRLAGVDTALLTALVRPAGYVPDFLFPAPDGRTGDLDDGLARIANADPDVVAHELAHLARHEVAQQGPGRERRAALMRELLADPSAASERIATGLHRYWQAAIAPHWSRMRALLQADLAYRLEELATGGVARLFATLHPSVAMRGDLLTIVKYYDGRAELRERGLLLVPCVFVWPEVMVGTADPLPNLTYAPRGPVVGVGAGPGRLAARRCGRPDQGGGTGVAGVADDHDTTGRAARARGTDAERPPEILAGGGNPHRAQGRTGRAVPAHRTR